MDAYTAIYLLALRLGLLVDELGVDTSLRQLGVRQYFLVRDELNRLAREAGMPTTLAMHVRATRSVRDWMQSAPVTAGEAEAFARTILEVVASAATEAAFARSLARAWSLDANEAAHEAAYEAALGL